MTVEKSVSELSYVAVDALIDLADALESHGEAVDREFVDAVNVLLSKTQELSILHSRKE